MSHDPVCNFFHNFINNLKFSIFKIHPVAASVSASATMPKFPKSSKLDLKTLTSTVSAQRTHSFKSLAAAASTLRGDLVDPIRKSNHPTVTFQLPATHASPSAEDREATAMTDDASVNAGLDSSLICQTGGVSSTGSKPAKSKIDMMNVDDPSSCQLNCSNITSGFEFSRKIAEYFVAKQAFLIENNEHEAMNPIELLEKIDELIAYDSTFSEAYYLRYLNYMRLKDYPMALKAMHDYFDRLLLAGSVSLAALNLCSLEYRFDNK
jgi:hypothetical protein